MKPQTIMAFCFFLALSLSAGVIGSRHSPGPWYAGLVKPSINPPSWVFAPVWTALYILIGIAAFLVWRKDGFKGAAPALISFAAQLILNAAWTWIFFGLRQPRAAFIEILFLWAAIALTLLLFWRHRALAGALLLPYLAWVTFASVLTYMFWRLNPEA